MVKSADPSGLMREPAALRLWDCGLDSRRWHWCLLWVLCYQVKVSATCRSLVQGSPT